MSQSPDKSVIIFGAGSVGCFLAAHFISAGIKTVLVGRGWREKELREFGLTVTNFKGKELTLPYSSFEYKIEVPKANGQFIFLCQKSFDVESVLEELQEKGYEKLVPFQNGLQAGQVILKKFGSNQVARGIVPFNVLSKGKGIFHQGTEGDLHLEDCPVGVEAARLLAYAALPVKVKKDIERYQWGKLLMNLNNPINALSGLPLKEQLAQRDYRVILAASIAESLRVLKKAKVKPARMGKVVPSLLPSLLPLPNWVFRVLASGMLKIDPEARSSMWDDIKKGSQTEINFLNGEILEVAKFHENATPVNAGIYELIKLAEKRDPPGSFTFSPKELREKLMV